MTKYKDENYQTNWYRKQAKDPQWAEKRREYARSYYQRRKAENDLLVCKALISAVQADPDPEKILNHFEIKERK